MYVSLGNFLRNKEYYALNFKLVILSRLKNFSQIGIP